jgi:hypothetical protein
MTTQRRLLNLEPLMGVVMIKCPNTTREISTGIVTDRASFETTPVFFARVYCPICRIEHEWFARDGWVCDAPLLVPSSRGVHLSDG